MNPIIRFAILIVASVSSTVASHVWDGSTILPVHRIPLMDENNVQILAGTEHAMPISTRMSCDTCHDVDTINKGWHFSAEGDLGGRPTEPWVWVGEKSGTQIPISLRGDDNTWALEALGMSDWDFVKEFGRHMPGGGPGDAPRDNADPHSRWKVSGQLEANCFACHNTAQHQDMTEWVKQVARENYRWAATAAACLGEVNGMASRLPSTWIPSDGIDPDDHVYRVPPSVKYSKSLFDSKNRVVLDLGKPTDARCLQCHTVAEVGREKHHVTGDIHTISGMNCVSCHRNDIDHNIDRGITGRYSCEGCHMGDEHGHGDEIGTYGAPIPGHKGMPPIHFEKLACTTCHSGVSAEHGPAIVRTSRINRLGIHGRAQWMTEAPRVVEPVFMRDAEGRIAPHRMMWPSFWAQKNGDDLEPMAPDAVTQAGGDILNPAMAVARILSRLNGIKDENGNTYGQAVFINGGKVYQANADAGLDVAEHDGSDLPDTQSFGYKIDGALVPLAELYDAKEENAFYYLEERRQDHVINLLAALAEVAPQGSHPAWLLDGKSHTLENATYERIPTEVVDELKKTAADAKVAVDALATKLDVAAEVDGTKQKFYRKSDKTELRASKSKTPELYELKLLMKAQGKAESALNQYEFIGDKVYRNTFQKNTSRYPVIKDFSGQSSRSAGWGWVKDDTLLPLVPDTIGEWVSETVGGAEIVLSESQVATALRTLGSNTVYVASGKVFSLKPDGTLETSDHARTEPVAWPIGHDVRPAAQSLGAKSCTECHSADAPFLFAPVTAQGPLSSDLVVASPMIDYMGMSGDFNKLFGFMFSVRPLFKASMMGLAGIAILIALAHLLSGIRAFTLKAEKPALRRAAMVFGGLSTLILAITGFGALPGESHLGGYPLLAHTAAGGLFALCLAAVAVLLAKNFSLSASTESPIQTTKKLCFWVMMISGIVLILSILIAMVPVLGTHGQHTALNVHVLSSIVFTVALALYSFVARRS